MFNLATCDRELTPGEGAPEWVHLLPPGRELVARDGRSFVLDNPAGVLAAFRAGGIDLPVDCEHQNDRPSALANGPVPAAGWIKELRADERGIWGRVEWTATAGQMIARREYRFISPSVLYDPKTKAVLRLKGAGLVHNPALPLTALAREEPAMPDAPPATDPAPMARLAEALGLPEGSDARAIMVAVIAALRASGADLATAGEVYDPAQHVPIAAVQDLMQERASFIATMREAEARRAVDDAIAAGQITPAMRPWALALCARDPDSFASFVKSAPAPFAHLTRATSVPAVARAIGVPRPSDDAAAICAQLGIAPEALGD